MKLASQHRSNIWQPIGRRIVTAVLLGAALLLNGCRGVTVVGIPPTNTPTPTRADLIEVAPHNTRDLAGDYQLADDLLAVADTLGRAPNSPFVAYDSAADGILLLGSIAVVYTTAPGETISSFEARLAALRIPYDKLPSGVRGSGGKEYLDVTAYSKLARHLTVSRWLTDTAVPCPNAEVVVYDLFPKTELIRVNFVQPPPEGCVYAIDGQPLHGSVVRLSARITPEDKVQMRQFVARLQGTPEAQPTIPPTLTTTSTVTVTPTQ